MAKKERAGDLDILEQLRTEHREVASLMNKVEKGSVEEREELFEQIRKELTAHADAEEKQFYPFIEQHAPTRAQHASEEHDEVRSLLEELAELDIQSDQWMQRFSQLKQSVEHHVREEENEIFRMVQERMDQEEGRAMRQSYEEEHDAVMSQL